MSKKEWITVYEYGDIEVEVWRDGVCDKCNNQGIPVITFNDSSGTIVDLCFDCLQKAKDELKLTTVKHAMFVSNTGDSDTVCGVKLDRENIKAKYTKEVTCPACTTRIMEFLHSKGMGW